MALFTGFSSKGVPYGKLSDRSPALEVFTGFKLVHQPPCRTAQQGFYLGPKRLPGAYRTYLPSRKPDLLKGYTVRDVSNDFAEMIHSDLGGPVHIMCMSVRSRRSSLPASRHAMMVLSVCSTGCTLSRCIPMNGGF